MYFCVVVVLTDNTLTFRTRILVCFLKFIKHVLSVRIFNICHVSLNNDLAEYFFYEYEFPKYLNSNRFSLLFQVRQHLVLPQNVTVSLTISFRRSSLLYAFYTLLPQPKLKI